MFKIFGAVKNLVKAKDAEAAKAIEDNNIVSFAEQDLEKLRSEYEKAVHNCGNIKGRIMTLTEDIKAKTDEVAKRTTDAEKLLKLGKEDLVTQQGAIIEGLTNEINVLQEALKQQNNLYAVQEKNKTELQEQISTCETSLRGMKTMEEVKKSNEALTTVDVASGKSALGTFKEREKRLKEQLTASTAVMEEQNNGTPKSVDEATAEALGNKPGSDFLNKLKAKQPSN